MTGSLAARSGGGVRSIAAALKAAGRKARGFESLPLRVRRIAAVAAVTLGVAAPAPAAAAVQAEPRVEVRDFAFSPNRLTVGQGTDVVWELTGRGTHTITADDGSFSSDELGQGDTYEVRLERLGEVGYFCAIHPSRMRAVVEVVAGDIEPIGTDEGGVSLAKLAGYGLVAAPVVFLLLAALFWLRPRSP